MNKSPWKSSAIAVAATLALGLYASDASALALGRVTVQSALGEPFRAEIDIPEINADEAASLRAKVASGAAFRSAGMELTPTIASLNITLQRRGDGRYYLRLSSDRAVNEPFLDLVLEASWASGRVVRDYTMLFDPPNLRQAPPVVTAQAPVAPRVTPAATPPVRAQAPVETAAAPVERPVRAPAARQEPAPAVTGRASSGEGQRVTVRAGETAGRIAAAHKPPAISLDQMLVAMLRANPDAFVSGNVNRLRAGAVLDLPTAEQAGATEAGEARQLLVAQSRDFNEFRRRLAEGAPTAAVSAADRQAGGRLQAQVEEKAGPSATPDKLTLSKGAVQGKAAAESIARERAAQEDAARMAELNKNIADLNKLTAGTAAAGPAGTTGTAGKPGTTGASGATATPSAGMGPAVVAGAVPKPAVAGSPATPAVAGSPAVAAAPASTVTPPAVTAATPPVAAAATASTPAPEAATSATPAAAAALPAPGTPGGPDAATPATAEAPPAAVAAATEPPKPATPAATAPPAPVETSLVDDVLQNPWLPAVAGGLLVALLGFGIFRVVRRKKAAQVDSSFLESRTEPDSFFGASGGQRIDTAEGGSAVGSSMVYSASQLDAAGDVDPVAEADVYLAYGRDLQAEEILKEALRTTPERVAVHSKLLEIYAKRKEVKAFNKAAEEAFSLTRGQGQEWNHICALGHEIDPENPLYTSGGNLPAGVSPAAAPTAMAAGALGAAAATSHDGVAHATNAAAVPAGLDLDLDLDLSPGAVAGTPVKSVPGADLPEPEPMAFEAPPMASLPDEPVKTPAAVNSSRPASFEAPAAAQASAVPVAAAATQAPASDSGMIEFDLSALSLDLDPPASFDKGDIDTAPKNLAARPQEEEAVTGGFDVDNGDDPLATKLALAEEFSAIGDPDGARSLAEEVRNEASGDLKGRAERFLAELS